MSSLTELGVALCVCLCTCLCLCLSARVCVCVPRLFIAVNLHVKRLSMKISRVMDLLMETATSIAVAAPSPGCSSCSSDVMHGVNTRSGYQQTVPQTSTGPWACAAARLRGQDSWFLVPHPAGHARLAGSIRTGQGRARGGWCSAGGSGVESAYHGGNQVAASLLINFRGLLCRMKPWLAFPAQSAIRGKAISDPMLESSSGRAV